jgi:hypothetical protein
MKPAPARGHPDLARRGVPVHDDFRAVVELDFDDAARLQLEIELGLLERPLKGLKRGLRSRFEFALVHAVT